MVDSIKITKFKIDLSEETKWKKKEVQRKEAEK